MNNLLALYAAPIALSEALGSSSVSILDVDPTIPGIFGVSSDGKIVGVKSVDQGGIIVDAEVPDSGPFVCLHSLPELEAVFLASSSGKLLLLEIGSDEWQMVGEIEGGLLCASWSSDDEVLMCLTKSNTLVVLNVMWDVLAEKQLDGPQPSMGFISWTGDGLKAVLQTVDAEGGRGQVIVLDRDLKVRYPKSPCSAMLFARSPKDLQVEATSESEMGLGESVAFSPDGGLIASTRKSEGKHEVIFFEPNGLRHYEFALRADCLEAAVKSLAWNIDGTRTST
jgi:elongator complex protein 1